ncbi:MAG: hypothetical protein KGZ79_10755 [Dethiobacter sp.]|nr:hypothetical protein [Dethiobacter sp.]
MIEDNHRVRLTEKGESVYNLIRDYKDSNTGEPMFTERSNNKDVYAELHNIIAEIFAELLSIYEILN